uniref:MFS domain-containing protein n=1 Tax=Rhabditophanes sp. KR3021 TaxID=114890 RepID=A0AC35U1W7_9BILA
MRTIGLSKLLPVKKVHDIIKNGGSTQNGVRILDCTYNVSAKPDPELFLKNEFGKFDLLMQKPSRHKADFLKSHIPTAVHFDLDCGMYPSKYERFAYYEPELFEQYAQKIGIDKDDHLIFYSRGPYNGMLFATKIWWLFKCYGHKNMSVMNGGFETWVGNKLEVESGPSKIDKKGTFVGRNNFFINVSYDELTKKDENEKDMFGQNDKYNMLDVRPANQFTGEVETGLDPMNVNGAHISGAISLPALEFMNKDGTFKDEEGVKAVLERRNIDTSKTNVTSCNAGIQATITSFCMENIYPKVAMRMWSVSLTLQKLFNALFREVLKQIFPIYLNYVPKWKCSSSLKNETLISDVFDKNCDVYRECPKEDLIFNSDAFKSANQEFQWTCSESIIVSFVSMIQYFGVLCGALLYGCLGDHFGRKPISFFILALGLLSLITSAFVPNWKYLLALRFIVGLSNGGTMVVVFVYMNELLLSTQRMALRAFVNWGNARVVTAIICYYFNDWRSASIACGLFSIPALVIIFFLFPESPTYLYNKKKFTEYRKACNFMSKIGGEKEARIELVEKNEVVKFSTVWTSPVLKQRIMLLAFMWFTASISSYSNDLNSSSTSDSFFLNQILLASFIAFSKILLGVVDMYYPHFDRRLLHLGAQTSVCSCFGIAALLLAFKLDYWLLLMVLSLIGTMSIELTWDACFICSVENIPTEIRSTTLGICSLIARIAALLAPGVVELSAIWSPSVYIVISGVGFFNLLLTYKWLPNTKGVDLNSVMNCIQLEGSKEEIVLITKPKCEPAQ